MKQCRKDLTIDGTLNNPMELDREDRSRSRILDKFQYQDDSQDHVNRLDINLMKKPESSNLKNYDVEKLCATDPIIRYYQLEQERGKKKKNNTLKKRRAPGAGRPLRCKELDNYILNELEKNLVENQVTPRKMHLIEFAIIWKDSNPDHPFASDFKHSKGWSYKFWIRNLVRINQLRVTSIS